MPDPAQSQWFVARGNNPIGPMSFEQLRAQVLNGKLTPNDRIWKQGTEAWITAGSVEGLFTRADLSKSPPPMPTQPLQYASPMPPPHSPDIGQDPGMRMLLPVGRSGWAIAAGYLGLFSVLIIFAPFAIIVSLIALRHLRRNPQLHGKGRAYFGLLMGLIFTFAPLSFLAWALITGK